jgi:hypothetical protein
MGGLFHIVYVITATAPLSNDELRDLLKGSHERNARADVTGLLLYKDCQFMQALEGEEATVIALFSKIARDSRHHHVIPLLHEPIAERQFPESLMAYRDLNQEAIQNMPGYSEFLNTPLNGDLFQKDIPKCQRLCCFSRRIFAEQSVGNSVFALNRFHRISARPLRLCVKISPIILHAGGQKQPFMRFSG